MEEQTTENTWMEKNKPTVVVGGIWKDASGSTLKVAVIKDDYILCYYNGDVARRVRVAKEFWHRQMTKHTPHVSGEEASELLRAVQVLERCLGDLHPVRDAYLHKQTTQAMEYLETLISEVEGND